MAEMYPGEGFDKRIAEAEALIDLANVELKVAIKRLERTGRRLAWKERAGNFLINVGAYAAVFGALHLLGWVR